MLDVVCNHYIIVFYSCGTDEQIKVIDSLALLLKMGFMSPKISKQP